MKHTLLQMMAELRALLQLSHFALYRLSWPFARGFLSLASHLTPVFSSHSRESGVFFIIAVTCLQGAEPREEADPVCIFQVIKGEWKTRSHDQLLRPLTARVGGLDAGRR